MDEKAIRGKIMSVIYNTPFLEDPEVVSVTRTEEHTYEVLVDDPSNQYGYRLLLLDAKGGNPQWEENEINPVFTERFIL